MIILSCDSVVAGDFFPQPDLQVQEKEMGQHAAKNVMMPAAIFPNLVVVHPKFGFSFLNTLFYSPANAT